jgi:uncharacterized membrane protein
MALALVIFAYFVEAEREAPIRDIFRVYENLMRGVLALANLWTLITGVALLALTAFRAPAEIFRGSYYD